MIHICVCVGRMRCWGWARDSIELSVVRTFLIQKEIKHSRPSFAGVTRPYVLVRVHLGDALPLV